MHLPIRSRIEAVLNRVPLPFCSFDPGNSILLTGSSRSGTTWLGQVLGASREYCLVNEPLMLKMHGLLEAGFTWRTYRDPAFEWRAGEAIFRRYLRGEGMTLKLLLRNRQKVFTCDGVVLKCVRANRLLPWFVNHFPRPGVVLLIRHPCAVVSSQMARFTLTDLTWADDLQYLESRLPHLLPFARTLETEEERRALTWSLDQHAPLAASPAQPWITLSYEQLVVRGRPELERLCEHLGMGMTPSMVRKLSEDSWQTQDASVDHSRASAEERLSVWRRRLTPDQIARILAVVQRCGIRGFSGELFPAVDEISVESSGRAEPGQA